MIPFEDEYRLKVVCLFEPIILIILLLAALLMVGKWQFLIFEYLKMYKRIISLYNCIVYNSFEST